MGFCQRTVASALLLLHREQPEVELEPLLRAALKLLTPPPSSGLAENRRPVLVAARDLSYRG
jgi:hypothetical protein